MSATERQFVITDDELLNASAPSFADLEVPADYEATLIKVEDYDNTSKGGASGWVLTFSVEGLPFKMWIAHTQASRWKLIEMVHAFEPGFFEQRNPDGTTRPVPINSFVGRTVGAHVILDEDADTPRKVIQYLFSLGEPEPSIEDVPAL